MPSPDNQTPAEWIQKYAQFEIGTGICLFETFREGEAVREKELRPDVLFEECVAMAEKAVAFKWVPHSVVPFGVIEVKKCGKPCAKTCVEPACICDTKIGRCV